MSRTTSCCFDHCQVASDQSGGSDADRSDCFSRREASIDCLMLSHGITIVTPVFNGGRSRPRTNEPSNPLREGFVAHLPDYVVAVFWFASTAFLGATGWMIAGRLFPQDSVLTRVAHAIVIGWAHVVAISIAVGAVSLLLPTVLLISVTLSAVITLILITRRIPQPANVVEYPTAEPYEQTSLAVKWLWPAIWAIMFAFWIGHAVTGGMLRFPTDWDTLMYHLPMVNHWLQARSLYAPDGLRWSDPGNNELITLWMVGLFSGDFLHALTNFPSVVLLACASVEFGRQVGLSATWRNLAGFAVVTTVVVFKQLIDAENDVAVAALFLACLAYGLRYADHRRIADLILGVVCLGLLAGVKFYALGYAAVAAATLALLIARRMGMRAMVRATVVGMLGCAVFGGYWYARNWIAGGSPFYPFLAPVEGEELGQLYPSVWETTFIGNGRPELFDLSVEAVWGMAGPCHLAALLGFPLTVFWLLVSGFFQSRRTDLRGKGAARVALATAMVGAGLVLIVTPFAVEDVPGTLNQMHWKYCPVRYGVCFLSLTVIGLAVMLYDLTQVIHGWSKRLRGWWFYPMKLFAAVPPVLLAAGVVFQMKGIRKLDVNVPLEDILLLATDIVLIGVIVSLVGINWPRARRRFVFILMLTGAVGAALTTDWLAQRWHQGFEAQYDKMLAGGLFRYLEVTQPAGSGVCVLDHRAYPFFGSARQFRVCQPHQVRSGQELMDYLRTRKVVLVAARFDMGLTARGWQNCRIWLTENEDLFVLVRAGPWPYTVFHVAITE